MVIFASYAHAASAQPNTSGHWIGQLQYDSVTWQRINFDIRIVGAEKAATLDLPASGRFKIPLRVLHLEPDSVRLDWPAGTASRIFDGRLINDTISGSFGGTNGMVPFRMVRAVPLDTTRWRALAGSYRVSATRFIDIGPWSENEDRPVYFDSESRRVGVLYALSDSELVSGPLTGAALPVDILVRVRRDASGTIASLRWVERGRSVVAMKLPRAQERNLEVTHGSTVLRGTLTLPAATSRRAPAVVFVHGSGPSRRPFGYWPYYLARHGIAFVSYDKRGSGSSTGDWATASTADLAEDLTAVVDKIRGVSEVDSSAVGVWGHSNGGWVVPLAASRSRHIAFVIARSASGLPVHENVVYEIEGYLHPSRANAAQVDSARELRRVLNRSLLSNTEWTRARAALDSARGHPWWGWWFEFEAQRIRAATVPLADSVWRAWKGPIEFDPFPAWQQVSQPVLVQLGERDRSVPSDTSKKLIDAALRAGGNRDFTVMILPRANHGLFEATTGFQSDPMRELVPGFLDTVTAWIVKRFPTRP